MTDDIQTTESPAPKTDLVTVLTGRRLLVFYLVSVLSISAGALSLYFLPDRVATVTALAVFCIGLWATAPIPQYWTALAFFLVTSVFQIAPPEVVFSGFHSSTFWLLWSGLVLGEAIRHTGLGARGAALLSRILGKRYSGVIGGIVLFSLSLAFFMPTAMGRVLLLLPVILALADHLGYPPNSPGRTGMLLAAVFATFAPAFTILPSNAPNMILSGMTENLYGFHLSYQDYLFLHFPVLGALKACVIAILVLKLFPDHDPAPGALKESGQQSATTGKTSASPGEKRLAGMLVLCLCFWMTDGLHHIAPVWIGMTAALICLLPGTGLTSPKCLNQEINYGSLFFIAGIMGLGAVIAATGTGTAYVDILTGFVPLEPEQALQNVIALTGMSTLIAIVTNLPGVPAVMTPVAQELASLTGLSLSTVLMTQVLAYSNVLLPYQAPPLLTAMQVGKLPLGAVSRFCLCLFAVTLLVLTPLDLLWWHMLGMFGG